MEAKRLAGARVFERRAVVSEVEKKKPTLPDAPLGRVDLLVSTASSVELDRLVSGGETDPHAILGPHSIQWNGRSATAVRALFPDAVAVNLVTVAPFGLPAEDRFRRAAMKRVHDGGVFELVLPKAKNLEYHFEVEDAGGFVRRVDDPYRFPPSISDLDMWLFNEGSLERTSSLLGARETTVGGVRGFGFTVWAPNAKRISLVGDFNEWDPRMNPMRQLGQSGVFELFIPKLPPGEPYMFEIASRGGAVVRKSDPCALRTELRPSTSSVTHRSTFEWSDASWLENRTKSRPLEQPVSTYEVHLGSWKRGPAGEFLNYRQLADMLAPYLTELNFTHVELIGLAEHPFDGSWGYQVTGYYAPTSRHGTPDDFKYFVDKMHEAGIGVLYDWVPAHFPKDSHGLAAFDGTHLFDHRDPRQGEHKDWDTRIFNYGRREVSSYLTGSLMHMIEEYHLDGARVDAVASMLYLDYSRKKGEWVPNAKGGRENLEAIAFLKQANKRVGAKYPGVMRIAEESTAFPGITKSVKEDGIGFDLKWNMGWMNDTLRWFETHPNHRGGAKLDALTNSFLWAHSERYVCALSHDEVTHGKRSLLEKMPGDDWQKFANLRLLYGYMWSYPGHKLLMMGSELGQREEWNHDSSLSWASARDDRHRGVSRLVADLNRLYRAEPALYQDQFSPEGMEVVSRDPKNVTLCVLRRGKTREESVLFVHNMTHHVRREYRVGVDLPGTYRELLNTDDLAYGGSGVTNGSVESEPVPMHGKPHSVKVTLPPLATIAVKLEKNL